MVAPVLQSNNTRMAQSLAQAPMTQADRDRQHQMQVAWKAYTGDFQPPLKVSANQPDDNVISNRSAPIVDKGVSFLFGAVLKIECDEQDYVKGLWGDDDAFMTLLSKMAINGGSFGQVFVKLIPMRNAMKYPRIVNLDPRLIRIVTDPEDCDLHLAYIIEYPGIENIQKRQIIARVDPNGDLSMTGDCDPEDTWTITNYIRHGNIGTWRQVGASVDWLYPFAPILTCQNLPNPNEPFGRPDLTQDLIGQNNVLNFLLSCMSRILKYHGHPKTYATGLAATQINIGIDDLICLPSPDAKLANLEMTKDLQSFLSLVADIRSSMDEQSRVPSVALGRLEGLPRGNISGVALQLLFQPLMEKTIQKQRLYGGLIRDITRACLVLAGKIGMEQYEDYPVELHWQNLLPVDDLLAAQSAILLKQLGVSAQTLLAELGYDPDDEATKSAMEAQRMMVGNATPQAMPPNPAEMMKPNTEEEQP